MGEALRLPGGNRRLRSEELDAVEDGVVEVETLLGEQPLLIFRVDERRLPLGGQHRVIDRRVGVRPGAEFHRRYQLLLGSLDQFE